MMNLIVVFHVLFALNTAFNPNGSLAYRWRGSVVS